LIEHRETVSAALQVGELIRSIRHDEDRPIDSIIGRYSTDAAYIEVERLLEEFAKAPPGASAELALAQARALRCNAQLLQRPDHPHPAAARPRIEPAMGRAFAKIADASEIGHRRINVDDVLKQKLKRGIQITAEAPVRLDLAGGWTDTPPYCFERGGHVLNVAIDLDGRPPVRAVVRTLVEPKLVLESHDLGKTVQITRAGGRGGSIDVSDPFALHKVALVMAGLLPDTHTDIVRHLRGLGAGLHVITESRVPKGSGLGTSSILAAVLLAALHRLRGRTPGPGALIEQTLLLEQRLGTGGGWQDQVGGIIGGVKSTVTAPQIPQRPRIAALELGDEQYAALEERLVVYYSGQQRLARDILRRVMARWLAREPAMQLLADSLKRGAADLRDALLRSDWSCAAEQIGRYWQIKKELYPGSTTPAIDLLLLETKDDYLAAGLAGAGGGGFAYFICNDAAQAKRLRSRLADYSSRPGFMGSVYATQINRAGLRVRTSKIS
jgi:fucokinase